MDLGLFSVSLAVKDLEVSRSFYNKLGFATVHAGENYEVLANGSTLIGLFQGMFEDNILTFNPGWGEGGSTLDDFTDVRAIAKQLTKSDIEGVEDSTGESSSGPAYLTLVDPDGNAILIDQHV
ncbi:MAG: VOC family protein [Actinomycetia bacterium]|nr:VOC family protein [Actinomycetes bacterium]